MPILYHISLITLALLVSSTSFAEMYKWTDEKGQVHYTQTPPQGIEAKELKAPPPPTINPNDAQRKVERLIEQQKQLEQQRKYEKQLEKRQETQLENEKKRCATAKSNLENFRNNPSRKVRNEDGSITRLTEENRQQQIQHYQDRVNIYCE